MLISPKIISAKTVNNSSTVRVLNVVASMNPIAGGISAGISNQIPELEKLGVVNDVVCLNDPDEGFVKNSTLNLIALGNPKSPWQYNKALEIWLSNNLKNYDAVIVQGLWLYHSYITAKMVNKLRKGNDKAPLLFIMPHGMLDPYFQKAASRRLKALRNLVYWKLVEGKVIESADALLFTTQAELTLARLTFSPYRPRKEVRVGYGIQHPPSYKAVSHSAWRSKYPQLEGKSYLLFLGRIHEKKGVDLLVDAYLLLLKKKLSQLVNSSYKLFPKLVIAGPGIDTAFGQQLTLKIASDLVARDWIIFPGMLTGADKWNAIYNAEAFILPSHQENFGVAVVEALACGKPVLISDQVNICHEIENYDSGLIASTTPVGVVGLIQKWIDLNTPKKKEMSENAIRCYIENFTIESATKSLVTAITYS